MKRILVSLTRAYWSASSTNQIKHYLCITFSRLAVGWLNTICGREWFPDRFLCVNKRLRYITDKIRQ